MHTQKLPRTEYLDLIFEGRNKAYGAYVLRVDYSRRMKRAALALFALAVLLTSSLLVPRSAEKPRMPVAKVTTTPIEYGEYHIRPKKVMPPEGGGSKAKTDAFTTPKVVADDPSKSKKEMAKQEDLSQATIAAQSSKGDGSVAIQSSGAGVGTGTGSDSGNVRSGGDEAVAEREFSVAEENPEFPGGESALMQYLASEIRYPERARNAHQQGQVVARFLVGKDGSIESITIRRSFGFGSEEETMRVLRRMPRWHPGKVNGKPVRCWIQLPVQFLLE